MNSPPTFMIARDRGHKGCAGAGEVMQRAHAGCMVRRSLGQPQLGQVPGQISLEGTGLGRGAVLHDSSTAPDLHTK